MNKHSKSFEQYCCSLEKNVIFEETCFHNGTKITKCVNSLWCERNGGCKNVLFKEILTSFDKDV